MLDDAKSTMTNNEIVLACGVAVTLVLGIVNLIYNYRASRRAAFVNVVTAERIKWIAKVRENVSLLCALCDQWTHFRTQDNSAELQRRMMQLRNEIRLQLNPRDQEDQDIERILARIPSWTTAITPEESAVVQGQLVSATQAMLKREWDKVKDESKKGDLRK